MKSFRLIGLMSGTSLDGLDIADVTFTKNEDQQWIFNLNHAETVDYSDELNSQLLLAPEMSAEDFNLLSVRLGQFYGKSVNTFISTNQIIKKEIVAIASHGQTIFHQPENSMTVQIGNTPHLATETGLKSIVDFRTKDVALGGNGAPLIPIVDHMLFSDRAEGFLNLGGFSNLSFKEKDLVRSFDIGPANIVINHLVKSRGLKMDKDGKLARSGNLIEPLFNKLEALEYYKKTGPKSLGWEWVQKEVLPLFRSDEELEDKLYTYIQHVSNQLVKAFCRSEVSSVMISGGGVHNSFLIETLKKNFNGKIIIPENEIIDFKEAIGFAFLGLLRCLGEVNVLSSVTGASKDSCSGVIYEP